jgi:hypothetical protein
MTYIDERRFSPPTPDCDTLTPWTPATPGVRDRTPATPGVSVKDVPKLFSVPTVSPPAPPPQIQTFDRSSFPLPDPPNLPTAPPPPPLPPPSMGGMVPLPPPPPQGISNGMKPVDKSVNFFMEYNNTIYTYCIFFLIQIILEVRSSFLRLL